MEVQRYIAIVICSVLYAAILLDASDNDQKSVIDKTPRAPVFKKEMQNLIVKPAGNMVTLKCRATGYPEPNITWYKDGEPPRRQLGDVRIAHWSLVMEDLVTGDKGDYLCVVCNLYGCINHTFNVDVIERYHNRPVLTKGLENETVVVGTTHVLTCNFVADLNPYIQWMKRGENGSFISVQQGGVSPEVYEIQNVSHQDEGWYACIAANSLGETISEAYLKVIDSIEQEPVKSSFNLYLMIALITVVLLCLVFLFLCFIARFYNRIIDMAEKQLLENDNYSDAFEVGLSASFDNSESRYF